MSIFSFVGDCFKKMRNVSLDWLRGIAIFVVVWSHIALGPLLDEIVNPVVLGIFFIISGIFNKCMPIKELVRKKAKTLLLPWVLFVALGYMYHLVFAIFIDHSNFRLTMVIDDLLIGNDYEANIPCWFFISLFEVMLLYAICEKLLPSIFRRMTVLCILSILGNIALVFGLNGVYFAKTLFYVFLFGIGELMRNYFLINISQPANNRAKLKCFIVLVSIFTVILLGYIKIRYIDSQFIDYVIGTVMAVLVTNMVIGIGFNSSNQIKWYVSVPAYLGRNSLVILGFHILAVDFVWRVLYPYFHTPGFWLSFFYAVITVVLCIPVIVVYNQYVSKFLR